MLLWTFRLLDSYIIEYMFIWLSFHHLRVIVWVDNRQTLGSFYLTFFSSFVALRITFYEVGRSIKFWLKSYLKSHIVANVRSTPIRSSTILRSWLQTWILELRISLCEKLHRVLCWHPCSDSRMFKISNFILILITKIICFLDPLRKRIHHWVVKVITSHFLMFCLIVRACFVYAIQIEAWNVNFLLLGWFLEVSNALINKRLFLDGD